MFPIIVGLIKALFLGGTVCLGGYVLLLLVHVSRHPKSPKLRFGMTGPQKHRT